MRQLFYDSITPKRIFSPDILGNNNRGIFLHFHRWLLSRTGKPIASKSAVNTEFKKFHSKQMKIVSSLNKRLIRHQRQLQNDNSQREGSDRNLTILGREYETHGFLGRASEGSVYFIEHEGKSLIAKKCRSITVEHTTHYQMADSFLRVMAEANMSAARVIRSSPYSETKVFSREKRLTIADIRDLVERNLISYDEYHALSYSHDLFVNA